MRQGNQSALSSKLSQSHEDEATVSKSLTDLADLPTLGPPIQKKKAAIGWNDDGFEDWNLDDVNDNQGKEEPKKQQPTPTSQKDKWAPPSADLKKPASAGKKPLPSIKENKPASNFPIAIVPTKSAAVVNDDSWGDDGWGETEPAPLDTKKIDYHKLDLNKLSDAEIARHKAEMDKEYQKKFIKKGDANFVYDKKVDFTGVKKVDASWDESQYSEDYSDHF